MTTFRGAVLRERGLPRPYVESRPLEIVELELPDPGPGEILVKIGAASLCRSDLSVVTGARVWPLPMVIGHEAAGQVVAVGPGVVSLQAGDDVVLVYLPQCGVCDDCRRGEPWLCDVGMAANRKGELLTGGTRLTHHGEAIHHHMGVAAFAEYALVAAASAVKVPPGLPAKDTCVFGCAVLCGAGTALNTSGISSGQSVAVIGLGAVGLSAVLGAKAANAEKIVAIDRLDAKLLTAISLGATEAVLANEDTRARVLTQTGGGVDHAIEASGTKEGFDLAASLVRRGGTVSTLGLPAPEVFHELVLAPLVANGVTIRGSYLGSCDTARDVPRFLELYQSGRLPAEQLVSHHIALEDINSALDRLADGEALRQVIEFETAPLRRCAC
ncbi:MAG: alcohol dehydrogenase catalytic domain-containing protein [Acidimicrobiia bacterium]|nr:alcohol dehydrogenase catalytic domain-containing protein [Acidimicrobiia bacterium]